MGSPARNQFVKYDVGGTAPDVLGGGDCGAVQDGGRRGRGGRGDSKQGGRVMLDTHSQPGLLRVCVCVCV